MQKEKSIKVNALLNIIKQCCNILLPLITYPYISRVVGAASLGRFSFADSIVQYAIILATLGAPAYAIREGARVRDNKKEITALSAKIFTINIISMLVSLFVLTLLLIFSSRINKETTLILILCINMVSIVLGRDWINSIYEEFLFITLRYIIFQVLALIFLFMFVKSPDDLIIYTVIVMFGNAGAQIANIFHTAKIVPYRIHLSKDLLVHLKPILYMFGISVASIIYINSDITILGFMRSEQEVGVYYIVGKVYTIIKALLNAIITVSVPRLSYYLGKNDTNGYRQLLSSLRIYLYTFIIPCIVGLFMLSENILKIIGGNEYSDGVNGFRLLCSAMFFAVFACFYSQSILIPNRKENVFMAATIISAIINVILNLIFIPLMGIRGAALTTLISEIVVLLICSYKSRKLHDDFGTRGMLPIAAGSLSIVVICIAVKYLPINYILQTILSVICSVISYSVFLIIGKNQAAVSFLSKFSGYLNKKQ